MSNNVAVVCCFARSESLYTY